MIAMDILILLGSLLLLALVGDWVIRYTTVLSKIFGLSEMAAGFILLSVSTSLPELSVSIIASLIGEGGLSFGNLLGSNVANLTIILGSALIIGKTRALIEERSQKELVQFLFLSSTIPLFVVQRGSLSLVLGIVLLILFIYFSFTLSKGSSETKPLDPLNRKDKMTVMLKFVTSMALVMVISKFTVDSSIGIALSFGLPPSVIGATIVVLGTSLPELTTTIQALRGGLVNMALGNLIGSCITNLTLVLGASSLIAFSEVNVTAAGSLVFFVLLSALYLWYIISSKGRLDRREAYIMIAIYVMFVLQELGFSLYIF